MFNLKLHTIPHCLLKKHVRISDFPIQSLDEIRRGYYIWTNAFIDYDRRPNLAGVFVKLGSTVYFVRVFKTIKTLSSVVDAGMKVASIADKIYNSHQVLVWTKTCLFVQNNYLKNWAFAWTNFFPQCFFLRSLIIQQRKQ